MNFSLILFLLVLITGFFYVLDLLVFKPKRKMAAEEALANTSAAVNMNGEAEKRIRNQYMKQPLWLEYSASFFPVILFVFVLRSFVVEPFKIPSGSMIPTLLIGDLILVNKFTYGIRLPIVDKKIIPVSDPQRGDVMVFRYPHNPSLDYIKRVVGLPGDRVEYLNKQLRINGEVVDMSPQGEYLHPERMYYSPMFEERLGNTAHAVLIERDVPAFISHAKDFPHRDRCTYTTAGVSCTVPEGHYFMMGDNRDGSNDSRYWGFVPDRNIVGKAFFIWMNFGDFKRIGTTIK